MQNEKMAISRKQISTEVAMVTNEITDDCIYTGFFGSLDSARMNSVMQKVTQLAEEKNISVVILDLGNVDAIDTAVAGHLNSLGKILKLVGVTPIICGITANLANTMVQAGVSFEDAYVVRDLKIALKESFLLTGYTLSKD